MFGSGFDHSVFENNFGSECPEAFDMLIDGAASDITSSGEGDLGMLILSEHCTDQIIRSPDLLDILITDHRGTDACGIDGDSVTVFFIDNDAYASHGVHEHVGVTDIGNIVYMNGFVGHNRSGEYRERSILCSADLNLSYQ